MSQGTGKKVPILHDPVAVVTVLLRGIEVGFDLGGELRCRVDGSLGEDELQQVLDALPELERRLRRQLARRVGGGRSALH